MTSQTEKQKITINILLDISRRKGDQTMELGQCIENNMRNIFLEISSTKCAAEAIARPFS